MKRLISICIAVILLTAIPAISLTGNQLKQDAVSPGCYSKGYFDGYVLGVLDLTKDRRCIPERVEMGQTLDVIKNYLNDHPEELHLPASDLVLKAIQMAWPCK
jgi:hypothetical protein